MLTDQAKTKRKWKTQQKCWGASKTNFCMLTWAFVDESTSSCMKSPLPSCMRKWPSMTVVSRGDLERGLGGREKTSHHLPSPLAPTAQSMLSLLIWFPLSPVEIAGHNFNPTNGEWDPKDPRCCCSIPGVPYCTLEGLWNCTNTLILPDIAYLSEERAHAPSSLEIPWAVLWMQESCCLVASI